MNNNYNPELTLTFETNVNSSNNKSIKSTCYREDYVDDFGQYRLHRLDGPAIESTDGFSKWYYHGEIVKVNSQEEFEKFLKLKAFW